MLDDNLNLFSFAMDPEAVYSRLPLKLHDWRPAITRGWTRVLHAGMLDDVHKSIIDRAHSAILKSSSIVLVQILTNLINLLRTSCSGHMLVHVVGAAAENS